MRPRSDIENRNTTTARTATVYAVLGPGLVLPGTLELVPGGGSAWVRAVDGADRGRVEQVREAVVGLGGDVDAVLAGAGPLVDVRVG
ncbi:hypothetical protein AGMMS50218_15260 [Actinomycetota bacterium]|nr:hypothetical protein AGMMS50218_15260 [Actinomycetota bacterium]